MEYLNSSGLSRLWDKIKSLFVSKKSIDYAGLTDKTYTTIGEQSATTSIQSYNDNPYAKLTSLTSFTIVEGKRYRVTFDGNEYELSGVSIPVRYVRNNNRSIQLIPCIGNVTLYNNGTGNPGITYNVPFLITNRVMGANGIPANTVGPFIFTSEAGAASVKIEEITYQGSIFPHYLIDGTNIDYVRVDGDGLGFPSVSVGDNRVLHFPAISAFGDGNEITSGYSCAIGIGNGVSGQLDAAIGAYNNISSTAGGTAIGSYNTVSGVASSAIGYICESSGTGSLATGLGTIANHLGQSAFGVYNVADTSSNAATSFGDYLEIVGNGASDSARSNARMLGVDGTEYLTGGLVLGYGTQNQNGLTASQLGSLLSGGKVHLVGLDSIQWDLSHTTAIGEVSGTRDQVRSWLLSGDMAFLNIGDNGDPIWLLPQSDDTGDIYFSSVIYDRSYYQANFTDGSTETQISITLCTIREVPSGGTTGQVLTKTANGFAWQNLPVYNGGFS